MRKLALVLFVLPVISTGAFAQTAEGDASCRAPVSLENRNCVDMLAAGAPGDRPGSMEQRDDGYYVFVPRQSE